MKISYLCLSAFLFLGCGNQKFNESETAAAKKSAEIKLPISKAGSEYKWKLDAKKLTGELFLDGKSIFKGNIIEGRKDSLGYGTDFINGDKFFMCGSFELVYGPDSYHSTVWRWPGISWPGAENIYRKRCEPTFAGSDGDYKGNSPINDGVLIRIVENNKDHK